MILKLSSLQTEIGHFLREHIIPRSVLYFTGEAIEDDADDYDEGEEADEVMFTKWANNSLFNTLRSNLSDLCIPLVYSLFHDMG